MLSAAEVQAYVHQRAPAFNLDPLAVLSVGAQEGLFHNPLDPGDAGTSFGPWQLHIGGALPGQVAAQGRDFAINWAWSPEGIEYALGQMAGVAAGLRGSPAIANLVNKFERPREDLRSGEIAQATNLYQQHSGGAVSMDGEDIGAPPGGLPTIQTAPGAAGSTTDRGFGLPDVGGALPAGASLPGAQATDPEGFSINPTTLSRHVYIGANNQRYWLKNRADGSGTDLVPIAPNGQAPAANVKPVTVAKGALVVMPDGRVITNTGAGGLTGNTTITPGQTVIGPGGNVIAAAPSNPSVLGQGQIQVGPNGQILAQNPALSPEQIALKQQELNQNYQVSLAEAQRRWQQDRDTNAYNLAVTSIDGWYKNETLRNQRLVAAQNAAVSDRQMAQPMMGPRDTVILPSAMVGSAFSGDYGPNYTDTAAWGQVPNAADVFKAQGGGVPNEWPTVLQPQRPPVVQGQQPTTTAPSTLTAASIGPTTALNQPPYSDAAARIENGLGGWRTWPPAETTATAPSGITPADVAGYPAQPAAPAAPQEGSDYIYGTSPTAGQEPAPSSGEGFTPGAPNVSTGTGPPSRFFPQGTPQGEPSGPPPPSRFSPVPPQPPIDWGGITWPDLGSLFGGGGQQPPPAQAPAGPPSRFSQPPSQPGPDWSGINWPNLGAIGAQITSPAQPMGQEQWDDALRTWRRPNGDVWDPNVGQWRPPSDAEGAGTFPAPTMGPSASSQIGEWLGNLNWGGTPQAPQRPPGPPSRFTGGGEWDFGYGSGQGDPLPASPEDLRAIGAGPDLGAPAMPPPGGSASPVPPDQVVGHGNEFGQPVANETPYHKGEDYQAAEGTPVQSPVDGTVVSVGERGDLGLSVVIQDQAGQTHELNHLNSTDVQQGDQVQVGQDVGVVGTTGQSTGAHLDYRVRGQTGDFTNPNGLAGVGDVLGGMPNMEGLPQDQLGAGQGDSWYPYTRGPQDLVQSAGGWTNQLGGRGGGEWDLLGSGQGEGEEQVTYYADGGSVIRKTTWGGDESTAVYEDTGYTTLAPDGTGGNSAEDLWHYGSAGNQPAAAEPAAAEPAAAGQPATAAPNAGTVSQPVAAAAQPPATTNPTAAQRGRGPFTSQNMNGWEFVYDADGNLVTYRPSYDPSQINAEGDWKLKLQKDAEDAARQLAGISGQTQRDVAGIGGRANVLATWGRSAAGSPWIARLTGRSPAPGDIGSPEATGGFGWPPQQSQQSANLLGNITGPSQSPTTGSWQEAVPGATSGAYSQKELGWNDLIGQGQGDAPDPRLASGLGAGGLAPARISPWDNLIRQNAGDFANDDRFIRTVAAGARAESSDDPRAYQQGYNASDPRTWNRFGGRGLWQFDINPGAMGHGASEQDLFSPEWQAQRIVPEYANAYRRYQGSGLNDAALAAQVYGAAERPAGTQGGRWTSTNTPAYQNYSRAYNELGSGNGDEPSPIFPPLPASLQRAPRQLGSGAGDSWSDYANVNQQFAGMESGWPTPPSAEEFTNLGPFGQSAMRYGMESAGVPWRPWADAMLGAWRQTNQQAPTGLSGWSPRNVSRLGYDTAGPTTRAQYSNEAELFMPASDWMEKEQRRWQPEEARVSYAA